jgi:hypothetical protein
MTIFCGLRRRCGGVADKWRGEAETQGKFAAKQARTSGAEFLILGGATVSTTHLNS